MTKNLKTGQKNCWENLFQQTMPFSVGVLFEEEMTVFAINQFAEKGASTRGGGECLGTDG